MFIYELRKVFWTCGLKCGRNVLKTGDNVIYLTYGIWGADKVWSLLGYDSVPTGKYYDVSEDGKEERRV